MKKYLLLINTLTFLLVAGAQPGDKYLLLKPDRVFDGEKMQTGWVLLVKNNRIEQAGSMSFKLPAGSEIIELKGMTLLPGLIEGHSHLFLHPYNETSWNDQVLKESRAERTVRAVNHAKATLMAGFTTVRDLGTEGAMYDDVGLKEAIDKGIVPGPRMIIATRAIVTTGSYGPKLSPDNENEIGAAVADGHDALVKEIRTQIGKGADFIKLYADYRWGMYKEAQPSFTQDELNKAVEVTKSSGRKMVTHAVTPEAMKRATLAGVVSIEHGDNGTEEVFQLMKEKAVALCPTISAGENILKYAGWKKGTDPEPQRITDKKKSFALALKTGVTIVMGGDVGVFPHGENVKEMELMVEYGMKPTEVLKSATAVNAAVFGYADKLGRLAPGLLADIIAVDGDPTQDIKNLWKVKLVMKDGIIYKKE
ncbi:MAG TPA: amidohydrolase family protein [Chitinophagaceae bacterium]|nr:amidohydrolase family protein [Chitinophagaceae bacterium]